MNHIKLFEDFTNESLFKGIKNVFKSHISIIEDMLDDKEKQNKKFGISEKVTITYGYFYDEYTESRLFHNPDYDKIRKQVDKLKKQLEDKGYQVELDKKYGLQLTVTKIL